MTDLITVKRLAEWDRLKALVLDSVSSPITRRVYNMALNEFMAWYAQVPRPGFSKATVSAWRASLEARQLGSSSQHTRAGELCTGSCSPSKLRFKTVGLLKPYCR